MDDKNYFEIFDIPVDIEIDKKQLTQSYYALTMKYHPDRFMLKDQDAQRLAIENTSKINDAYKILKDDQLRLKYVLTLAGVEFVEGKETVPQEFLMEMMDFNEGIMEYKMDPNEEAKNSLVQKLTEIENKLLLDISPFFTKFKIEPNNETGLILLKNYYLKNQYLRNIKNNLNG